MTPVRHIEQRSTGKLSMGRLQLVGIALAVAFAIALADKIVSAAFTIG